MVNINLNNVDSINEIISIIENYIVNNKDKYSIKVTFTGTSDPFLSKFLGYDTFGNINHIKSSLIKYNKKLEFEINTSLPKLIKNMQIKDFFHLSKIKINYYILNNSFHNNEEFLTVEESIDKLMKWDYIHSYHTEIHFKINSNIASDRIIEIKDNIKRNYIPISYYVDKEFLGIEEYYIEENLNKLFS